MLSEERAVQSKAAMATVETDLERDAIGLLGSTMQAITHIAPAIAGRSS